MIELPRAYYGGQIKEGLRGDRVLVVDHVEDRLTHYGARITRINWPNLFNVTDGKPSLYKIDRVYIGVSEDVACKVAVDLSKQPHAFDWHMSGLDNKLLSSTTLPQMQFQPIYGAAIQEEAQGDLSLIINHGKMGHLESFLYPVCAKEALHFTDVWATAQVPLQRVYVGVTKEAAEKVMESVPDVSRGTITFDYLDRLIMDPRFLK